MEERAQATSAVPATTPGEPAAVVTSLTRDATGDVQRDDLIVEDVLVEDVSIDGMCGVY